MAARVPVTFSPAGVTVWVASGSTVLAAARSAGVLISAPCGGRGVCGSCGVRVLEGVLEPPDEIERGGLAQAPQGIRLACRARVAAAVVLQPVVRQAGTAAGAGPADEDRSLVAGVDLGTTTVSAVIVSATSGRELGRSTVPNAQAVYGADVLTRISASIGGSARDLSLAAERSVTQALEAACGHAGTCLGEIDRMVIACNTAMAALLAEVDPTSLAGAPFEVPAGIAVLETGLLRSTLPDARIDLVPPIASFVGGDAAAGLLAAGMLGIRSATNRSSEVLVDLGTNAEILAVSSLGLTVASAPAGPAFEGFGISSGGPWAPGAIEEVARDGTAIVIAVAGGGPPAWLCGSGLTSAIAVLRESGHLTRDGLMVRDGIWQERFADIDGVVGFSLAADGAGPPFLLQTDVRAFQMAKSAVASGLSTVLKSAGIKPNGVSRTLVAGGFGSALNPYDLVALGVVPQDLADQVEVVGNTSLLGAAMLAFDPELLGAINEATAGARHIELATDEGFSAAFMEHLVLEPFKLQRGVWPFSR